MTTPHTEEELNRIIKFRAWDKISQKMKDWDYIQLNCSFGWLFESYAVAMQFTGLLDRLGKEIYEGDIVKMYIFDNSLIPLEIITSVSFYEGTFTVIKMNEEPLSLRDSIFLSNKTKQGIEIIGNVYSNPELLNNKELK